MKPSPFGAATVAPSAPPAPAAPAPDMSTAYWGSLGVIGLAMLGSAGVGATFATGGKTPTWATVIAWGGFLGAGALAAYLGATNPSLQPPAGTPGGPPATPGGGINAGPLPVPPNRRRLTVAR